MMNFDQKVNALTNATCLMNSSKELNKTEAIELYKANEIDEAHHRLERAARYAWGFNRPAGWYPEN